MSPDLSNLRRREYIDWLAEVHFPEYSFAILTDGMGGCYLVARFFARDARTAYGTDVKITDSQNLQETRAWLLHVGMTKSEFVATCFKCVVTSLEHEARESFKYRGEAIYGPHHDVDALHRVCVGRSQ